MIDFKMMELFKKQYADNAENLNSSVLLLKTKGARTSQIVLIVKQVLNISLKKADELVLNAIGDSTEKRRINDLRKSLNEILSSSEKESGVPPQEPDDQ